MLYFSIFLTTLISLSQAIYYDSYRGVEIGIEDVKKYNKINATFWCTNDIKPCNPREGKRIDGSCNNPKYPSTGAANTPQIRLLPASYDKNFQPKKTKAGNEMPQPRFLRTHLLSEGRVPDQVFTQLATYFVLFGASDVLAIHDSVNYVLWKQHCCTEKGKTDKECAPIKVPEEDPVFRYSNIRCLNMTKPISYQFVGCTRNDTVPERVITTTTSFDLSHVYGHSEKTLKEKGRLFQKGLLKYEVENGKEWPPSYKTKDHLCYLNQKPAETRCHDTPEPGGNTILGINLFFTWTWRYHNKVARELAAINPCWSDEKLFYTARDINIAGFMQMYLYEMLSLLMGRENLIRDGVLSASPGFRDIYNPNVLPKVSLEFPFIWRYMHTMQEGIVKMYDDKGNYMKQIPIVNVTLRTGYLSIDNNMDYITQGSFRQGSGKVDYTVDYDLAGSIFGSLQRASDVFTSDLAKNRMFGLQPYIKYKEYCTGKSYNSFESLADAFYPENLEILKSLYEDVADIDLLAGVWLEKLVPGGHVPTTFYCLVVEQLVRTIVSDRHWYERPNRPYAFTAGQLEEIRKSTVAQLLCAVGDSVTEIPNQPFLRSGPKNKFKHCKDIPAPNLEAWRDPTCASYEQNM